MADMILMRCKYCGGMLTNSEGNVWVCQNCGTRSVIDVASQTGPTEDRTSRGFRVSIERDGTVSSYKVRDKAELQISFNRRATMADMFPIDVVLTVDGRPRETFEHLPKTGTGSVVFETDESDVLAYATGKAFMVKDDQIVTEDEDAGGTYSVAGLNVIIERTGEMEK